MSKLVPLLFAGAGTTTVSVGGFYLIKGNGAAATSVSSTDVPSEPAGSRNLLFDSVDKFKKEYKGFPCVNKYFKNGDTVIDISTLESNASDFSTTSPTSDSFFTSDLNDASATYESCLFVN